MPRSWLELRGIIFLYACAAGSGAEAGKDVTFSSGYRSGS